MKRIIIAPHMKCNARCAHCCVSSNPNDTRQLQDCDVARLVNEAIESETVQMVSFTGGEALLRKDFILGLISRVTAAGKASTLVSNGFWGVTVAKAESMLRELQTAGLGLLTLSVDAFHTPYIPRQRIRNILIAHKSVSELNIALNICESKSNSADLVLSELEGLCDNVKLTTRFAITPVGQAANMPASEFVYEHQSTDELRCPGQILLFSSDDKAYPCCSTGVMNSALSIGNASELSLAEATRRIKNNLLLRIISTEGLGWLVSRYKELGIEKYQEPFPVVDACHLCCEVFSDAANLQKLRPELEKYREAYLRETAAASANKSSEQ